MLEKSNSTTSLSMLSRICKPMCDEEAWREFVLRYGKQIYEWCLNRRLQPADAEDVTQNVLIRMAKYLRTFEYDRNRSFRGWLRRSTENAISDFLKDKAKRSVEDGGSEILNLLKRTDAREELSSRLDNIFDLELFEEAMSRVSVRIATNRSFIQSARSSACLK